MIVRNKAEGTSGRISMIDRYIDEHNVDLDFHNGNASTKLAQLPKKG
jgi:hypothetical protein